jgi:exodeoxyribonuclease-3
VGHHPEEIQALTAIKELGFIDVFRLHQHDSRHYTFWDYRIKNAVARKMGWRIDHIWATAPLAQKSSQSWIDIDPRLLVKPSDHTYLLAQFAL